MRKRGKSKRAAKSNIECEKQDRCALRSVGMTDFVSTSTYTSCD